MNHLLPNPILTQKRIWLAFAIALAADAVPIVLGAFSVTFLDEWVDVVTMILLTTVIGFHPLLLPTFFIEVLPIAEMLPTWTGCVAVVVALRRKQQGAAPRPTHSRSHASSDVIDV